MDQQDAPKKKTIADLNECFSEGETVDKPVFAEQRTNIRLAAGDHYSLNGSRFPARIRDQKVSGNDSRLRLTMNHTGRISRIYQNSILSNNPNVTISPKQPKEIEHQKSAELNNSVLEHIKQIHKFSRKKSLWCKDYVEIGEVFVKVFWDPAAGPQIGWAPQTDENGIPLMDYGTGQMMPSQTPQMQGDVILELIHGFDLIRDPASKSMDDSPYLIYRKMVSVKDLKARYQGDETKTQMIQGGGQDTFRVFQTSSATYSSMQNLCQVKEHYYRPCSEYPQGYWYLTTDKGILEEGELPLGIFPIFYVGFDELTTSPRSRSIIKQLRAYQIEINRAASAIAEHQITLGSDKLIIQSGSKASAGVNQPGIRQVTIAPGNPPTIIPGRSGEQFFQYYQNKVTEMYQVADVPALDQEINGQIDPYALLFRSIRQKQKFAYYAEKFEQFLCSVFETALELYRNYCPVETMIPIVGKSDMVNIQAFKQSKSNAWTIAVEPMSDDIETKMGRQLTLNHTLQYVGNQLSKNDIGKFIRLSPYLNNEKSFSDMTNPWDNLVNDILQLDRGQMPPMSAYEDHDYMIQGLVSRMKQPDFKYLQPQIQQIYQAKLQQHEQIKAQQLKEIQSAKDGFIPSGGYAVACDLYVTPDASKPETTKRLRMPSEALQWLVKKLEVQGSAQDQIQQLNSPQAAADISQLLMQKFMGANDVGAVQ